jgi:y4mF family transcriptional regulator
LYPNGYNRMVNVIADFVKEMRRQFGLTQVDLADKSGVGLRFVRELEQGKQTLRLDKVNQVLGLFGRQVGPVDIVQHQQ